MDEGSETIKLCQWNKRKLSIESVNTGCTIVIIKLARFLSILLPLLDRSNRSFVASKETKSSKTFTNTHRQGFLCLYSGNLDSFSIIYPMWNCLSETIRYSVVKQLIWIAEDWKWDKWKQCNNTLFLDWDTKDKETSWWTNLTLVQLESTDITYHHY